MLIYRFDAGIRVSGTKCGRSGPLGEGETHTLFFGSFSFWRGGQRRSTSLVDAMAIQRGRHSSGAAEARISICFLLCLCVMFAWDGRKGNRHSPVAFKKGSRISTNRNRMIGFTTPKAGNFLHKHQKERQKEKKKRKKKRQTLTWTLSNKETGLVWFSRCLPAAISFLFFFSCC